MKSKNKKRATYFFDDIGVLTVALRTKEENEISSYSIGASEASLDKGYLEANKQLLNQIALFGENLAKQLNVSAVRILSINFGTVNYKKR